MSQPMPKDGQQEVMPELKQEFIKLCEERYKKGIETYGKSLQTFNGRDAGQDAMEEWFDLGAYLKQLMIEHQETKKLLQEKESKLLLVCEWLEDAMSKKTLTYNLNPHSSLGALFTPERMLTILKEEK